MSRWTLEKGSLSLDTRTYYPDAPEGPYLILRGTCKPDGPRAGYYKPTEDEICGREITVIVQCQVTPMTNGIRVWYQERNGTWYWQTSHFKNTLLEDSDFDALISPYLHIELGCDD